MEFYHLRSFVVVAKTENLTLAAKQLCTTPPAISAHIKALEDELQTVLFIRSSKGMKLTEKGEILLSKAQNTLDSVLSLVNLAANNQHEIMGSFHLAINQSPHQVKITCLVENMRDNTPGINLQITSMSTGKIIEAMREGSVDGGYVYGEIPDDFFYLTIKQQKITTIAPYDFIPSDNIISQSNWVTMGYYCPFDDILKSKIGNNILSVMSSDDERSRLELVKNGLGLSFYEQEEAQIYADKKEISIVPDLNFDTPLYFIVAKKRNDDPIIKAILQEIRVLWNITF